MTKLTWRGKLWGPYQLTDEIERLEKLVEDKERTIQILERLVEGKDELLVAYRIGKRPSEKTFSKIENAKMELSKVEKFPKTSCTITKMLKPLS